MITAILIDDEPKGRLVLRQKLAAYCSNVQVVAEADNGKEAIALIRQYRPTVVFLDIEMPVMNGFDILNAIEEKDFHIIFTTAYDQYAIKAIKYAAFDYLLKPVDIEELRRAVEKIEAIKNKQLGKQVELMQQNMQQPKKNFKKLAIPALDGLHFFDISDIIHLEAHSNYTTIHFSNHPKITASRTLKEFEELLPADIFFRAHHSHIINLEYVKRYIKGEGGQVELKNGDYVDISRRKKEDFLKAIG
jgi:two-component system, LytTR family, response regulator